MDQSTFSTAESHLDELADTIDDVLASSELEKLRDQLAEFGKALGQRYSVSLDMVVQVFDRDKERGMPLLTTGLSTSDEGDLYRTWSDSTSQRYLTEGEIQVVPHDHCPRCWGDWNFKFQNPQCTSCGAALGVDVKVLLDTDVCPSCEEGRVTMSAPMCERCGFEIDPDMVMWG